MDYIFELYNQLFEDSVNHNIEHLLTPISLHFFILIPNNP